MFDKQSPADFAMHSMAGDASLSHSKVCYSISLQLTCNSQWCFAPHFLINLLLEEANPFSKFKGFEMLLPSFLTSSGAYSTVLRVQQAWYEIDE